MSVDKVRFSHLKAKRMLRDCRHTADGEALSKFNDKAGYVAVVMGVQASTLWRYLASGFPNNRQAIKFCKALDRHPIELLNAESRIAYETLLCDMEEMNQTPIGVIERSLATCRLSHEILKWARFFATGVFDAAEYDDEEVALNNVTTEESDSLLQGIERDRKIEHETARESQRVADPVLPEKTETDAGVARSQGRCQSEHYSPVGVWGYSEALEGVPSGL